ncbi:MAG: Zn-dependent alcohol dehydrogenase [Deltaproteobacteria bacterium]|nr:Zn-dependent alcohol dehydrogenase [Deltaproteobacteria bacterium]
MKAALCYEFKKPLVVEEIEMDSPGKGEVKIRMAATAICHSDIHLLRGEFWQDLPIVAGHEAAGYVEEVGEEVTSVKPGDHVALTTVFSCGRCKACLKGFPHMCDNRWQSDVKSHLKNKNGKPIFTMSQVAGFSEYTIAKEAQLVKIPEDFPLDSASLLSCGVITGFGAVVNRAQVKPFSSVVVVGVGGVGINSIQGAAVSGAFPVIAVDTLDNKLEAAKRFGATHTINAKNSDPVEVVKELTDGWGAEYVFTTVATNDVIRQCVAMLGRRGMAVMIGVPEGGATFSFSPFEFLDDEKTLTACFMGSTNLNIDIPRLVTLYQNGRYKLDELISGRYPLEKINEAIDSVLKGEAIRNVIVYE